MNGAFTFGSQWWPTCGIFAVHNTGLDVRETTAGIMAWHGSSNDGRHGIADLLPADDTVAEPSVVGGSSSDEAAEAMSDPREGPRILHVAPRLFRFIPVCISDQFGIT